MPSSTSTTTRRAVPEPLAATINLAHLRHNARVVRSHAGDADIMAVVKADAYGHGAIPVARVLHDEGIRHFAVARVSEGVALRDAGITGHMLVFSAPLPEDLPFYAEYDLDLTVSSLAVARHLAEHPAGRSSAHPLRAHVKVDTGMGRIGCTPEEAPEVLRLLNEAPHLSAEGLWTHFATADDPDNPFAGVQLDRFEHLLSGLGGRVSRIHAANSSALFTMAGQVLSLPRPLVRSGIALYGLADRPAIAESAGLRPVMELSARVTHLKTVAAGTSISYGQTWTADAPARIATIGIGYGDGYPRLCSGRAVVNVRGEQRPVVGAVCMDMCMVHLGPPDSPLAQQVQVGEHAILFGAGTPSAFDVARWAETIPYEVCCRVAARVPRRYIAPTEGGGT